MNSRLFFFSVAAIVLAACTQIENPAESNVPVSLSYSTVAATETKAAQNLNEGTFASGESVKVRISNTGADSWTDYTFTTADEGAMNAPEPAPYYPAGSQNIDIVAYYPAGAGTSFSVAADQTADASYKASDLMFASVTNQARQAEAVNLAFSHKMAKLCVNVSTGSGVSSITSVSILNVRPTVSFNQATGAVGSAGGDATAIAMSNNGSALIPAQTINGGLLSIVTDKGTATYSVADKAFEAGKLYTLNITVNLRAVGATTAITGWTNEGTVTVVAERPGIAGHEYVEMGDGLKWAVYNVGASEPWENGDYFQWGVTVPYYLAGYSQESPCSHWIAGKTGYDWANYPFNNDPNLGASYEGESPITKYNNTDSKATFADDAYVDDPARQRWGSTWRTPTYEEWETLLNDYDNYDKDWTTDYLGTGKAGIIVTRTTGTCTGHSIFLPAAGLRIGKDLQSTSYGNYWSSSLFSYTPAYQPELKGWYANFGYELPGHYQLKDNMRYLGLTIRAVSSE